MLARRGETAEEYRVRFSVVMARAKRDPASHLVRAPIFHEENAARENAAELIHSEQIRASASDPAARMVRDAANLSVPAPSGRLCVCVQAIHRCDVLIDELLACRKRGELAPLQPKE
jgi:hypothetical protein